MSLPTLAAQAHEESDQGSQRQGAEFEYCKKVHCYKRFKICAQIERTTSGQGCSGTTDLGLCTQALER